MSEYKTVLLIDGENLDMTLGNGILQARPKPEQRPRWERVVQFTERTYGGPVRALFFLNVTRSMPFSFLAALQAMGLTPVPLLGPDDRKIVDEAIVRTLQALWKRDAHVLLGSHDADFVEGLVPLTGDADRRVGVIGFQEMFSQELRELEGLDLFDLEDDALAFDFVLPRMRAVEIDRFDPERFL